MKHSWTSEELVTRILEPMDGVLKDIELTLGMKLDSTFPEQLSESDPLTHVISTGHHEKKISPAQHSRQNLLIKEREQDLAKSNVLPTHHDILNISDRKMKNDIPGNQIMTIPQHPEALKIIPPLSEKIPILSTPNSTKSTPKTSSKNATCADLVDEPTDTSGGLPPMNLKSDIPIKQIPSLYSTAALQEKKSSRTEGKKGPLVKGRETLSSQSISPSIRTELPNSVASLTDVSFPGHIPLTRHPRNSGSREKDRPLKGSAILDSISADHESDSIQNGRKTHPKLEVPKSGRNELLLIARNSDNVGTNTNKREKGTGGLPIVPRRVSETAERIVKGMEPVMNQAYKFTDDVLTSSKEKLAPPSPSIQAPQAQSKVTNTFNVNVTVTHPDPVNGLDREDLRETLVDILREEARRHGLEV